MIYYLEWGICLLTLYIFFVKYRWGNKELMKAARPLLRKLEKFVGSQHLSGPRSKGEGITLNMPRMHFNRRRGRAVGASSGADHLEQKDRLYFYKSLSPSTQSSSHSAQMHVDCPVCLSGKFEQNPGNLVNNGDASGVQNCFEIVTREPENPWYVRRFASFVFFLRKAFLGESYRMVTLEKMMRDERVLGAIEECAREELKDNPKAGSMQDLIEKHRQRAERVVRNMRAKQASPPWFSLYVRFAAWIIGKTLALIYPKILVESSQIETIRKAKEAGHPVIYLPIHRSHTDYVLISWTLVCKDIAPPLVAAGDNLNIPVFNLMMKSVGGFFIKRRMDRKEGQRDILYRAILKSYMEITLRDQNDIEFFIEGGRTRTGKPCHPKGGLLNIAVDTMLSRKVEDILIVPVNFSYEKLLEGNFIREQLGQPKVKESFASAALGLWNSVQTKFGNARVDYGRPFSMKEFIRKYQSAKYPRLTPLLRPVSQDSSSSGSESDDKSATRNTLTESAAETQRELVNTLAKHIIYDGVQNFTLMSTSAISFILLNKYRNGVTLDKLAEEMDLLKTEMIRRNHMVVYEQDTRDTVEHGLQVLGPQLVRRDVVKTLSKPPTQIVLRPITVLPNVIELSYYSTCVTPIYALESVIATSILTMTGGDMGETHQIQSHSEIVLMEAELISTCVELCGILHYEFIFNPPCQTLEESIRKKMKFMQTEGLLRFQSHSSHVVEDSSDEELLDGYHNLIYVRNTSESRERLVFLKNLVKPILDTYAVSSFALKRLVGCEAQEKQLQMDMLAEVRNQLQLYTITYGESLGLDPIRNFIKVLTSWQVLESYKGDSTFMYCLQNHFDNEKAVDEVIQRVHRFHI